MPLTECTDLIKNGGKGGPRGGLYIFVFTGRAPFPLHDGEKSRKCIINPRERVIKGGKWEGSLSVRLSSYRKWGNPSSPPQTDSHFYDALDWALFLPAGDFSLPWGLSPPRIAEEYWNGRIRALSEECGTVTRRFGEYTALSTLDDGALRRGMKGIAEGTEVLLKAVR